jgi:PTH1 family peptidyl-tRNA hydrolase
MKKWLIIGLGNPGKEYEWTRHNAGFLAADEIRTKIGASDWKKKLLSNARVSEGEIAGNQATLILPETYMNESGRAARKFVKSRDDLSRLIVLHDDVHIPIGEFKIKFSGGDAGHNGITSLSQHLASKDYIRIRIGVGPSDGRKVTLSDFVLEKFRPDEREVLKVTLPKIYDVIEDIIKIGLEEATKKWHTKK